MTAGLKTLRFISVVSFISSILCAGTGFHRMYVYDLGSVFTDPVNAWVGGDAYNFIINGTHATAFFVLFFALMMIGLIIEMIIHLKQMQHVYYTYIQHKQEMEG